MMNASDISSYSGTTITAEEFSENWNIPCERRQKLLYELGKVLGVDKVPAPFWACLQVCDMGRFEVIVDNARHNPCFVSLLAKHCTHQIPLLWLQEPQDIEDSALTPPSSTGTNDLLYEQDCQGLCSTEAAKRDAGVCVFKRSAPMVTAHIYPDFNQKDPHAMIFWDLISIFWPRGKIRLWKELVSHGPDACFNSIYISPEIHRMWRMGVFALRPLEYNAMMTELEVEWHWQPKQEHSIYDSVPLNKLPLSSSGLDSTKAKSNQPIYLLVEFSPEVIRRVKTGDRFVFKTENPEHLPLPSKDLLEFQFHLQRIVSIAGAAGVDRPGSNYDDNDIPSMSILQASYIEQWLDSCLSPSTGHV